LSGEREKKKEYGPRYRFGRVKIAAEKEKKKMVASTNVRFGREKRERKRRSNAAVVHSDHRGNAGKEKREL